MNTIFSWRNILGVFVFSQWLFLFLNQPAGQRQAVAGELRERLNAVQNVVTKQKDLKPFPERQQSLASSFSSKEAAPIALFS